MHHIVWVVMIFTELQAVGMRQSAELARSWPKLRSCSSTSENLLHMSLDAHSYPRTAPMVTSPSEQPAIEQYEYGPSKYKNVLEQP